MFGVMFATVVVLRAIHDKRQEDKETEEEDENVFDNAELSETEPVDAQYINEEETPENEGRRIRPIMVAITLVTAIVGVVLFIITQNMNYPMILVDRWTILHAIILVIGTVTMIFAHRNLKEDDEQYDPYLKEESE